MRMKHLIYASIIASVPFVAESASAQGASGDPTLWGIYGAHNRHDCPVNNRETAKEVIAIVDWAVEREVREETGYLVQVTDLLDALGGPDFRHIYANGDRTEYMVVVFRCEIIGPNGQPDGDKISEARFFSRADAPRLAMPFPSQLLWGA